MTNSGSCEYDKYEHIFFIIDKWFNIIEYHILFPFGVDLQWGQCYNDVRHGPY